MGIILSALAVLVLTFLPARAEEEVMEFDLTIETKLVCDTQRQIERAVELFDGDAVAAMHAVNTEEKNPIACDVATIAYVPGEDVSTVHGPRGQFRVTRILVVGAISEDGEFSAIEPATYFTMSPASEDGLLARLR